MNTQHLCGMQKERAQHTIEDTLTLLECDIVSLRKEASLYKNVSIDTFKKLKVFTTHIIKNQVTLFELAMNDEKSWRFLEKRTATLSSTWNDRILLIRYLEVIVTLFDDLCDTQNLLNQLMMENLGLVLNQGPLLGSMFKE
ncbi:hypothetical protein K501DRAFT_269002 [Backusella circina FSU 941]|nr:hypothetical protein K501DRAFT_269002 [Backusella circina FSU 941]